MVELTEARDFTKVSVCHCLIELWDADHEWNPDVVSKSGHHVFNYSIHHMPAQIQMFCQPRIMSGTNLLNTDKLTSLPIA